MYGGTCRVVDLVNSTLRSNGAPTQGLPNPTLDTRKAVSPPLLRAGKGVDTEIGETDDNRSRMASSQEQKRTPRREGGATVDKSLE